MYEQGRYFVLTGQRLERTPPEIHARQEQIDALHTQLFPPKPEKEPSTPQTHTNGLSALDDDALLERARKNLKTGAKFRRLFDAGDTTGYPPGSQNEADQALANRLAFWANRDPERTDRLFRRSALMRPKWDRKLGTGTYGSVTVAKACDQPDGYTGQSTTTNGAKRTPEKKPAESPAEGAPEEKPEESAADALPPYAEERMALTFTERHQDDARFVGDTKDWLVWDANSQLWRFDVRRQVFNFARAIVREVAPTAGKADKMSKVARASARAAVVSLASDDQRTSILRSDLDRHPMLAATPTGILDLETGNLRHNDRGLFITKTLAVAPAPPGTEHPLWTAFLNSTFVQTDPDGAVVIDANGNFMTDDETIGFLQRFYGSCLTGVVEDQQFVFHHGKGRNGKGTLVWTIRNILGEYATRLPSEMFMERKMEPHRTELADLWGARLAVASEIPTNAHWNQSRLMDLTGGDPVCANKMRQDPVTVPASHKLSFLGNYRPQFRSINTAVIERLRLVRHQRSFLSDADAVKQEEGDGVRDAKLMDKLRAEYPAILRWLIDGCLQWRKDSLNPPASILKASRDYLGQENLVGTWMKECCETAAIQDEEDGTSLMRDSYNEWRRELGEFPVSARKFKSDVEDQGRRVYHAEGGTYILKLKLTAAAHEQARKAQALAKAQREAGREDSNNRKFQFRE
jgi:putative DNA primase/helicase